MKVINFLTIQVSNWIQNKLYSTRLLVLLGIQYGKCSKNLYSNILIKLPPCAKFNCLPLQNLLLPFASVVRRENEFRVFFLFWCSKF